MERYNMTLRQLIDEAYDPATIMAQIQSLDKLNKQNEQIAASLKNNPDLLKPFQSFQQLVAQQLKQKQAEAMLAQQQAQQAQNQQAQQATSATGQLLQASGLGQTANQ